MPGTISVLPADALPTRLRLVKSLHIVLEAIVLLLVCFAPWPFGSVHPLFESILLGGVALTLVLWSLAILVEWRFSWKRCPLALCLLGLVLVGLVQLVPLPPAWLRFLSPSGVTLLEELKPATPERLVSGEPLELLPFAAGSTLSLNPGGTRLVVLRLLAVFLLFAVVRNTFASKEGLHRLGLVCLVNGAALALFALVQFFTTPRHVIFWKIETGGMVFGTFINRNHFAFYVNICACLAGGLLAGYWHNRRDPGRLWTTVLQHAPSLWLGMFLLLILVSLAYCLSRGGLVALFVSCITTFLIYWTNTSRRSWQSLTGVTAILILSGLLVWDVLPRVEPRLTPLWHNNGQEGRLTVWAHALRIARDYPLAGSGYGTFGIMEITDRSLGFDGVRGDPGLVSTTAHNEYLDVVAGRVTGSFRGVWTTAHNEYLDALAEGGALRLLLSVVAVVFLFVLSLRAYRRYRGHPAGGWVLGAVAAVTTIVVHSFFDFGLHIPANAFLATVLTAQLAALGAKRTPENRQQEYELQLFGLGPLVAGAALVLLALTLASESWRLWQTERFRKAAENRDVYQKEESHAPQVAYLEQAVRYSPDNAALRLALAEAHLWQAEKTDEPGHRAAAARQLLAARNLCPVMVQPQLKLAVLTDQFSSVDAPTVYLRRATRLAPTDSQLWFLRGCGEQQAGDEDAAWQSWLRSLTLSDQYLLDILKRIHGKPDADTVAERLLPNEPGILVAAARHLYPVPENKASRRCLFERAAKLLQQQSIILAKDVHLRAVIQDELDEHEAAIESYRLALARNPSQAEWRFELADLLHREARLTEAQHELERVLHEQKNHGKARMLLDTVQRELQ